MAYAKIRPKRGTKSQWEQANTVLAEGELGIEVPNAGIGKGQVKVKQGDGSTPWKNLPYALDLTDFVNHLEDTENPHEVSPEQIGAATPEDVNAAVKKAAPKNLLDNSDFRNPVNQRGKTSYSGGGYCIDRWKLQYETNLEVYDGYITLSGMYDFKQLNGISIKRGEKYTVAARINVLSAPQEIRLDCMENILIEPLNGAGWQTIVVHGTAERDYAIGETNMALIGLQASNKSIQIAWMAAYEGEYTAETLPEYQPKGYGAELAECMRYYQAFVTRVRYLPGDPTYTTCYPISFMVPMRIIPTVTMINTVENVNGIEAISSFGATIHVLGQSGDGLLSAQFSADL